MNTRQRVRTGVRRCAACFGLGVAAYATYGSVTWLRYGHVRQSSLSEDADPLLDRYMPTYEVVERHRTRVAAPAEITLAAACEMDLQQSRIIHAIFRGRELLLGSTPDERQRPRRFSH
jgi:hypothetical protein